MFPVHPPSIPYNAPVPVCSHWPTNSKNENTPICLSLCTNAPDSYIRELESRQFLENANPQKHTRIIPLHTTLGGRIGEGRDIDMFFS
jgi:hypothetical protein